MLMTAALQHGHINPFVGTIEHLPEPGAVGSRMVNPCSPYGPWAIPESCSLAFRVIKIVNQGAPQLTGWAQVLHKVSSGNPSPNANPEQQF